MGLGQLTLRGRKNLVALDPGGDGLVLDTMRYQSELKDFDDVFSGIGHEPSRADMMQMAEVLIRSRNAPLEVG